MANSTASRPRDPAAIRRYYEAARMVVPGKRARADVLTLLEDRKRIQRAGEALMAAAMPYSGDANLTAAIDAFRGVLEGAPRA